MKTNTGPWSVRFSNGSNKSQYANWFHDKDDAKRFSYNLTDYETAESIKTDGKPVIDSHIVNTPAERSAAKCKSVAARTLNRFKPMSIIWRTVIEPPFITEKRRQEKIEIEIKQRWKRLRLKPRRKDTNGFVMGAGYSAPDEKSGTYIEASATMTIPVAIIAVEN